MPDLKQVHESPDWRIWEVEDTEPPVSGPARLTAAGANGFDLEATAPGRVLVRQHDTPYWTIAAGDGCISKDPATGWTAIDVRRAGHAARAGGVLDLGGAAPPGPLRGRGRHAGRARPDEFGQPPCPRSLTLASLSPRCRRSAQRFAARVLPQGWTICSGRSCCSAAHTGSTGSSAASTDGKVAEAFQNARHVIRIEHGVGLFVEPAIHAWATSTGIVIDAASWIYVNSHFAITTVTLAFIYLRRNEPSTSSATCSWSRWASRSCSMRSTRRRRRGYMPEWGFQDSVAHFTGLTSSGLSANALFNPFAAVPSMHVAFSLMLAVPMAPMSATRWAKALWLIYPFIVTFVVVATANHWWFDAFTGALVAGLAAVAAVGFARLRPTAWAWVPPTPAPAAH